MDPDVSYDSELVRQVRESRGLRLKQVAFATGYTISSIHRYEHGQAPVAYGYASRLFQCTGDVRLLQFMAPGVEFKGSASAASAPNRTPPPGEPKQLIQLELEAIEETATVARYVYRIVSDNVVNGKDDMAIGHLQAGHNKVRKIFAQVDRALAYWRQQTSKPGQKKG
ncbi:MAG TPA: helix-turn-helix domain-containing protein [Thermoguttaceae bacterium]|nr:helix-turn-helix domain-containing protein [Thermoguttaceae bacterium]